MSTHQQQPPLIEHLRKALETTLESATTIGAATLSGRVWRVRGVEPERTLTLSFDEAGAAALARAATSSEGDPTPDAIAATLLELCTNAVTSAASDTNEMADGAPKFERPELVDWSDTADAALAALSAGALPVPLVVSVAVAATTAASRPAAEARDTTPPAPPADLNGRLDVLLDIDLPLVVRFGSTDMPLKALSGIGPGSLIDLARAPEDPVDVLVGGRLVARGEVVVVSGSYGIRIVDVVGERERTQGMEA